MSTNMETHAEKPNLGACQKLPELTLPFRNPWRAAKSGGSHMG